jgi:hypothetical protein
MSRKSLLQKYGVPIAMLTGAYAFTIIPVSSFRLLLGDYNEQKPSTKDPILYVKGSKQFNFQNIDVNEMIDSCETIVNELLLKEEHFVVPKSLNHTTVTITTTTIQQSSFLRSLWNSLWGGNSNNTPLKINNEDNDIVTKYTIDSSTVVTRSGNVCWIPLLNSKYKQAIFTGILRSNTTDGAYDGKIIYGLATSLSNSPLHIDHIFFLDDKNQKQIIYSRPEPYVNNLDEYYKLKPVIQSVIRNGKAQSYKRTYANIFEDDESEQVHQLLQIGKPYVDVLYRRDIYSSVRSWWNKSKHNE